jgi:hypothetical protein
VTRRTLLRTLVALVACGCSGVSRHRATAAAKNAAVPAIPAPVSEAPCVFTDAVASIASDLRAHFDYLRFESDVLARYARLCVESYGAPDLTMPGTRRRMHAQFLLSTDFFQNGAAEGRTLRFVALYDPYVTPCYNPFVG